MTKIAELTIGPAKGEVSGAVKSLGDTRSFDKFGKQLKVANAILEDDSGAIKISLWNEDITKVKEGGKIKISNGYVNEFQGEKQLSAGKFGKVEVVDGSDEKTEESSEEGLL